MSTTKLPVALHEGSVNIGDKELACAVLNDGTRIISRNAIFRAFGRTKRGRASYEKRGEPSMPSFIDAKNLQPFMGEDLKAGLIRIDYKDLNGKDVSGYNALIIPMLCKIYLDARESGKLTKQQIPLARASEILLLGLSNVGIIALVDEATGYQYERERDELQLILKAYIAEELLKWTKTFPDVYYKEIFRLNGWDFTVQNIKKRPGVVGKWTNKIIYEQLPKGVLQELKKNTPKSAAGNYTARFFQSLTTDIGNPHLQNQLNSVITLMQISDNWKHFIQQFNKLVDRRKGQLELKFDDLEPKEETKKIGNLTNFDKTLQGILSVPPPKK
jgi:P63C domain